MLVCIYDTGLCAVGWYFSKGGLRSEDHGTVHVRVGVPAERACVAGAGVATSTCVGWRGLDHLASGTDQWD
jgi:hypothetical protein